MKSLARDGISKSPKLILFFFLPPTETRKTGTALCRFTLLVEGKVNLFYFVYSFFLQKYNVERGKKSITEEKQQAQSVYNG